MTKRDKMYRKILPAICCTLVFGCSKQLDTPEPTEQASAQEIQEQNDEIRSFLLSNDRPEKFIDMDNTHFPIETIGFGGIEKESRILLLNSNEYYNDLFRRYTGDSGTIFTSHTDGTTDTVFIGDVSAFHESEISVEQLIMNTTDDAAMIAIATIKSNTDDNSVSAPFTDAGLRFQARWQVDAEAPLEVDSYNDKNQHRAIRVMMRFVKSE